MRNHEVTHTNERRPFLSAEFTYHSNLITVNVIGFAYGRKNIFPRSVKQSKIFGSSERFFRECADSASVCVCRNFSLPFVSVSRKDLCDNLFFNLFRFSILESFQLIHSSKSRERSINKCSRLT